MEKAQYINDNQWDNLISESIDAANSQLINPFNETFEIYAFQKGFEACADVLKTIVIENQKLKEHAEKMADEIDSIFERHDLTEEYRKDFPKEK